MAAPTYSQPGTVLAGFDGSDRSRRAVAWAAGEARARGRPLLIAESFEWSVPLPARSTASGTGYEPDRVKLFAEDRIASLAADCRAEQPGLEVDTTVPDGKPEETLPALAGNAELVVLGDSGAGALPRAVLGSTASELGRRIRQPLVVVRGEPAGDAGERPIVVGADGSPSSERAVEFAFDFAARHRLPLHAVHAWSDSPLDLMEPPRADPATDPGVETGTDELAQRQVFDRQPRYPDVRVHWERVRDRPAHALVDRAEGAALLAVGSRGRGPLQRALLGSVSHAVLYHAPCPVALLDSGNTTTPTDTEVTR